MKLRPGRKKVSDLTSSLDSIVEPGLADRDLPILDLVPGLMRWTRNVQPILENEVRNGIKAKVVQLDDP